MKTIPATEFKAKCLHLLDLVQSTGEELVVSKRGKPVARIVSVSPEKPWLALRGKGRCHGEPGETALQPDQIEALRP